MKLRWLSLAPRLRREKNTPRVYFDGNRTFTFNNETRTLGGWNDPGARKLWLYNLHYMAWLFDLGPADRAPWIKKWIRENPLSSRGNGWEPYPLSLRLFYWCKHYASSQIEPEADVRASMGLQAAQLFAQLEFHIDANHLLENLLGLTFVGLYLDPSDAPARAARARIGRLLEAELSGQFLPDGGHYERSPMYHAILLERILDLVNVWPEGHLGERDTRDPFQDLKSRLLSTAAAGLDWLETMTVGGRFALFNDSAYDAAPEASFLLDYGNRLLGRRSRPVEALRPLLHSGYFRAVAGPATLVFDAGKLAPDHQMGHAQGDMLSFCLWIGETPVLVHPGNYEYVPGEMRDYCRSTASHNTLVPDGEEQAEWWSAHRVGRRGYPSDVSANADALSGIVTLRGSHNGFAHLAGHPVHTREIVLAAGSCSVRDHLSGSPGKKCRVYFHFHPDCVVRLENGGVRVQSSGGTLRMESDHPLHLEESWYCPEFGLRLRNTAVVVEGTDLEYRTRFFFS
jgi:uncharacterized heparinase superfamily protein